MAAMKGSKTMLKPHEQRVIDERKALDTKIVSLETFIETNDIFDTLSVAEQGRLMTQLHIMRAYSWVLNSRIVVFKK
jgi:hypothetical protein